MSAGEVEYWEPQESEELKGAFDLYEGAHWAVRTEDGTVWLLGPHAEEALRAKRPREGDQVQVVHMLDALGGSTFNVSIDSSGEPHPTQRGPEA